MRLTSFVCGIVLGITASLACAQTQPPGKQAAPHPAGASSGAHQARSYDTTDTVIGVLLADPAAKAVLAKNIPQLVDKLDQASGSTLREIQPALAAYAPNILTDAVLAQIDQDLAKLPPK